MYVDMEWRGVIVVKDATRSLPPAAFGPHPRTCMYIHIYYAYACVCLPKQTYLDVLLEGGALAGDAEAGEGDGHQGDEAVDGVHLLFRCVCVCLCVRECVCVPGGKYTCWSAGWWVGGRTPQPHGTHARQPTHTPQPTTHNPQPNARCARRCRRTSWGPSRSRSWRRTCGGTSPRTRRCASPGWS